MRSRIALVLLLLGPAASRAQDPSVPLAGLTHELAQHRARTISDLRYDLSFRIPAEASAPIDGTVTIRFALADATRPLVLDFDAADPQVHAVTIGGRPAAFQQVNGHIAIPARELRDGENELDIRFTAGNGSLNRNPDFLYTLFVPDRASNAFPSFDQPDMKAVYRLTLDVPADWEAVANGAEQHVAVEAARKRITFAPTKPISTYLFSFAAGRFEIETAERDGRTFRMFHREYDADRLARNRDTIFDLHATAIRWLEEYTGIPYPFGKFDFVLVPSFQYGGMEHPGAILYNASRMLLEEAATQNERLGRASLIAHETAHMWFGDLVTMQWFDDVWLKEVFANFMAAKIVNPSFPEIDHELRFLLAHHPAAYGVDRTAGTHAIRQRLDNLNEAGSLYGAIIYQKAPIVMRQLEVIAGETAFRGGLRDYLRRFSYANATWHDLVAILDGRTAQDLATWSRVWVEEAGRPRVAAAVTTADDRIDALTLRQSDPSGRGRTWTQRVDVHVGWTDSTRTIPVVIDGSSVDVPDAAGLPAPRYVIPDGRGLGYAHFELEAATRDFLLDSLAAVSPAVARAAAALALQDAMLAGEVEPARLLESLTAAVAVEREQLLVARHLGSIAGIYWRFLTPAERSALAPSLEQLLWRGLAAAEDASTKSAWFGAVRGIAVTDASLERLRAVWAGTDSIPGLPLAERDYTALAQTLALREVPQWREILEQQLERIDNPDRRARFEFIMPALSADPAVRDRFFASLADVRNRSHEPWVLEALSALNHPLRATHARKYIRPALELLPEVQRTGDIFFPRGWVGAALGGHAAIDAANEVRAFLNENPGLAPRLRGIVLQAADDLFRAAELRASGTAPQAGTAMDVRVSTEPGAAGDADGAVPAWRDATLPVDDRVRDLLSRMTLEEKFWQLYMTPGDLDDPAYDWSSGVFGLQVGVAPDVPAADAARAHAERINAIQRHFVERTRLGIPIIPFDEALHGVMREGALVFPQAIALAATWDSALVGRVAQAIARETRSRGIRQVLSPVVNIANDVRWGRVEETYGEDVHLTSVMGRAFVRAFERAGVITTPKHFVANVGEGGRDSYPIDIGRRMLEERFFPPFRTAIDDAGARSIMTAYNSVDGSPATQNRMLLHDVLRRDWDFAGFVISDAAATGGATVLHMTEASTATATRHAFEAGLDVVFQSTWPQHRPYLDAFRRGLVPDSVIDASVARVLRAKFELGLFEDPYVDPDTAAHWNGHARHRTLAREAARASIVLLRNERETLPLRADLRAIAVIGVDAVEPRLGGYSGPGIGPVSILDGIRARFGDAVVSHAPGPGRVAHEYAIVPAESLGAPGSERGLAGAYFDNNRLEGDPVFTRTDERIDFRWTLNSPGRGIPFDWYSVRWTGTITAPPGGVQRIGIEGNDGYRLWLDGRLVIDNWIKRSYGPKLVDVALAGGSRHDIVLEYFESTGNARLKLVWDAGVSHDAQARIDSAVAIATRAGAAIVVAGIEEGEFRDRASLALPGHQEALIRAVAATGTPTIIVLVGGSAITMSRWLDDVDAVVHAWYPGEEGGHAVADVISGDYNPAGRLPITFPIAEGQLPLNYDHKPTGRGDDYVDLTGQPLFPFGFGLSYTTFEYSDLVITPSSIAPDGAFTVSCTVRNTGTRAGDEVVQLYVRDVLASVARPVLQLAGFTRVQLAPGEATTLSFSVGTDRLRMLNREMEWVVEPGVFRVLVGGSSRDLRLRGAVEVGEEDGRFTAEPTRDDRRD